MFVLVIIWPIHCLLCASLKNISLINSFICLIALWWQLYLSNIIWVFYLNFLRVSFFFFVFFKPWATTFVEAPGLSTRPDKKYNQISSDPQFDEKLQAIKRSNLLASHILFTLMVVVGSILTFSFKNHIEWFRLWLQSSHIQPF